MVLDSLVLLWSGGKDAAMSLDVLHSQSPRRVGALLTTVEEEGSTVTMHGVPLSCIERQAERLDIPLHVMRLPSGAPNDVYEKRLGEALTPLLEAGFSTAVAGDLFLEDVKAYRERVLTEIGLRPLFPLWKRDTDWLARRFVERGYRAIVTSVDLSQLNGSFLGRTFDYDFLDDLPEKVDPCGENGEFHTFVIEGPPFSAPIDVEVAGRHTDDRTSHARLHLSVSGSTTVDGTAGS